MTADTVALVSRRAFLRGGRAAPALPRPPGALADGDFESACTRCGDCLAACPDGLLVKGEGGFPMYEAARGECTFCGDCTWAGGSGALLPGRIATPRIEALDASVADRLGITPDQARAKSLETIPVGRLGDPAEFGAVAAFLASPRAAYVTGSLIRIDGGAVRAI